MSALLLYEIAGAHKSTYLNAIEINSLDPHRELFLCDILEYFRRSPVGCNFLFYVLVRDRLVWLDSPTSLVPVCPDGIVRMVLKPVTLPPLIHPNQHFEFADKSRMTFYSRADYERSSEFAYRSFDETERSVALLKKEQDAVKKRMKASSRVNGGMQSAATDRSNGKYVAASEWSNEQRHSQCDDRNFADFDRKFSSGGGANKEPSDQHTAGRERRPSAYSDRPEQYSEHHEEEETRARRQAELRKFPSNKPHSSPYVLDHIKQKDSPSGTTVGEDTAAVLTEAVEAAGAVAKNFFSFATNLGKSVLDIAQSGAAQGTAALSAGGPPGRLREGSVVQVNVVKRCRRCSCLYGSFGARLCTVRCSPCDVRGA
jgi:hypothetical protein